MKDQSQEKAFLETQDIFEMPLAVLLSKYKAYLIEQGGFMTEEDYQRFRNEYKAEADLECLSCAVADAEEEHLKTIEILQADNDQMQELINFQRKRIEQIESENARLREALQEISGFNISVSDLWFANSKIILIRNIAIEALK